MPVCSNCGQDKDVSEFYIRRKTGKQQSNCIVCCNSISKDWYSRNREYKLGLVAKDREARTTINHKNLVQYLLSHPCVDCGESDPVVLEFDHVRGEKKNIISKMIRTYNWSIIEEEIAKCDIRCANCHRRKTAKQFEWFYGDYGVIGNTPDCDSDVIGS